MNQEIKDRIADEEEEYIERRLKELSALGQVMSRSDMHHKINCELDDIRRNRNAD